MGAWVDQERWDSQVDLSRKELLFLPINAAKHWTLLVCDLKQQRFECALNVGSASRALCGRESLKELAREEHLLHGFSAVYARRNGVQWPLLFDASVSPALRPRASLGDGISRSRFSADQLPRRGFSSSDSANGTNKAPPAGTKRTFNPNGVMKPGSAKDYYMVPPRTWNDANLLPIIKKTDVNARYIILHGPSQSGKSTRIVDLCAQLNREDPTYFAVIASLPFLTKGDDGFWADLYEELPTETWLPHFHNASGFTAWVKAVHSRKKKLVLFFDESDVFFQSASEELKTRFLTTLRNWKVHDFCPEAVFLVGRFNVTDAGTMVGSAFNVSRLLEAPLFRKEEVQELIGQFEKELPKFNLDPAIAADIYRLTGGHPGLTSLCGRMLEEIVAAKLCKPVVVRSLTLAEWQEQFSITKALDNFMSTESGRRMTRSLTQYSDCLLLAQRLLFAQAQSSPVPVAVDANDEAAKRLVQEGIAYFTAGSITKLKLSCPLVVGVVRRVFRPKLRILSPADLASAADLLRVVLPRMDEIALTDNATRQASNHTNRSSPHAPRESVVTTQLVTALRSAFPPEYRVQQEPKVALPPGINTYPDIVITTEGRTLFILELGVNMDLKAVRETARYSLCYHISKAAKYHHELKPRETWVIHFTTVAPPYPPRVSVPNADDVKLLHVYHDEAWTSATMCLPDGSEERVRLLPVLPGSRPFELESFLLDEAEIDADGVNEYAPLLRKNKVDEKGLRVLATKSEEVIKAELEKWGVSAGSDRVKLAEAIVHRFGGSRK